MLKSGTMGIIEQILDMARQEGIAAGLRKGLFQAKTEFVKYLFQHTSHSIEEIAQLANVSDGFARKIKKSLAGA